MKKSKSGMETGAYVIALVALIGGIVFFIFVVPLFGKTSGGAVVMLKKWAGLTPESDLEKQKEAERVGNELKENAENAYMDMAGILKGCLNNDKICSCGFMDFTKLNSYNLILRNERTAQTLVLADKNMVPLKSDRVGTFLVLHSSGPGPFRDDLITQLNNYPRQTNYILFSKNKMEFNIGEAGAYSVEKDGDMSKVFFRKLTKDVLVAENFDLQLRRCSNE